MGRKHPCACDTIRILLGGDCQRRGESLSACDTRGAFLGAGSRCVQRCAHGRYRQPRPLGKFKGESWAGIPYPLRQINAGEHDWGAVNIIKRFLWSNNSKRSNKTPIGISAWKLEGISKEDAIIYPYSSLTFLSLSK